LVRIAKLSISLNNVATSEKRLIWIVSGLALAVVIVCFATADSVLVGSIAATRYTARSSGLVLAFAVAARAPGQLASRKTRLTLAFVAAHGIHYATVVARAVVEPSNQLRHFRAENFVVVGAGVTLVVLIALTAKATSEAGARTNAVAVYVAWTALALASASRLRTAIPSAVVLSALVLAMLWRIGFALKCKATDVAALNRVP
jgi:hypothetical protein